MMLARRPVAPSRRHNGSVAVPFAVLLPILLGFIGLAVDLSAIYFRAAVLRDLADATALAAVGKLNGARSGILAAEDAAEAVADDTPFAFDKDVVFNSRRWTTNAVFVSDRADGGWVPISSVTTDALAARMLYLKVDTAYLQDGEEGPATRTVITWFIPIVGGASSVTVAPTAIAARLAMKITPLGVCALTTTKNGQRAVSGLPAEQLEFGYRRGMAYNLLDLNPVSSTAYLINPLVSQPANSQPAHFTSALIKPFFCSGRVRYGDLVPGSLVPVQALAQDVHQWLNSRFEDGDCGTPAGAPPDTNIQEYAVPGPAVAAPELGPLWAYKKPAQYKASGNYDTKTEYLYSNMAALYPGSTLPSWSPGYPSGTGVPYTSANFVSGPAGAGVAERRVLNLPLLDCSGAAIGSSASVLGVGRFFMTKMATASEVVAEFAGLAKIEDLAADVALLP